MPSMYMSRIADFSSICGRIVPEKGIGGLPDRVRCMHRPLDKGSVVDTPSIDQRRYPLRPYIVAANETHPHVRN